MTDHSIPSDLIDSMDNMYVSMLSKSTPSRSPMVHLQRSKSQHTSFGHDTPPLPSKSQSKPSNLSHVPCKFFKQGTCTAGANCIFSHNLTPSTETVCKYFLKGNCKFGSKCALLHTMVPSDVRKLLHHPSSSTSPTSMMYPPAQGSPSSNMWCSSLGYSSTMEYELDPRLRPLPQSHHRLASQQSSFQQQVPFRYSSSLGSAQHEPSPTMLGSPSQQKLTSIAEIFQRTAPHAASADDRPSPYPFHHQPQPFPPRPPPPSLASSSSSLSHARAHSYVDQPSSFATPTTPSYLENDIWSSSPFRPNALTSSRAINIPNPNRPTLASSPYSLQSHTSSLPHPSFSAAAAPSPFPATESPIWTDSWTRMTHPPPPPPATSRRQDFTLDLDDGMPEPPFHLDPASLYHEAFGSPTTTPSSHTALLTTKFHVPGLTPPSLDEQEDPFFMEDPASLPPQQDLGPNLGFYSSLVRPN
ncbi:hypothetical protein DM01DRAFT_1385246 [Hesseltinella vesiculosa]|uniref:C3H1-type domain-containing protein n=1 Tax=Hesseltinella vesiculosa TaxID=101127 RepID=A0A1X2GAD1_9FUNG|nr:hypothetical protein DM01DRAFT_1385246 [Hesseltinella vesiculosa]